MGKRKQPKQSIDPNAPNTPTASFHNPFAGLAALRNSVPPGEDTPTHETPAAAGKVSLGLRKVVVRHERKGRKGKTVTRISGCGDHVTEWGRKMKQDLGCGGAIEEGDIILAGDLRERVTDWLRNAGVTRIVSGN